MNPPGIAGNAPRQDGDLAGRRADRRIGLLGGSFDPVHDAHIALAQAAVRALDLAEVQLIPAANPWQRAPLKAAPEHRLRMLELAVDGHPGLAVNPIEITRGGATYTIDTLRALPPGRYVWLLGADQLANFCTWRAWQDIAAMVDLAVAVRPGTALHVPDELAQWLQDHGHVLQELPFAPMDVSASGIRERLAHGAPAASMLNPAVAGYIAAHGLYR
ncbi:nicotinate-nucleotide adenylyltransferase [Bordetella ansorpii]|uniref:Probable nicotinate-nucleotide adenylyltransferase n=1 Tax=Bordetella ansorpii TaxID=288768 RepID=A0A157SUY5_9BORD|nr:nicotinate (nicotinamide) nucleotide adenylyltransferase [Bordetella ansorpii]SAI74165.1 nicotinate-nucleotide adenylyltransferase [Bordetella ansorpii]